MAYLDRKWQKRPKTTIVKEGIVLPKYAEMTGSAGNYYNVTVDMSHVPSFPGDLACYCSTDHDSIGEDGIYMSYRKNGVWYTYDQGVANGDFDYLTTKPAGNPIYVDSVSGSQTETPFVMWVEDKFVLTYQQAGVGTNQSTVRALGADGINFARDKVVLDYSIVTGIGDGHTGYLRWGLNPFPGVPFKYIGYALHGGTISGFQCLAGCDDPRTENWTIVSVVQKTNGEIYVGADINAQSIVGWITADVQSIKQVGRYWVMLVGIGPASSAQYAASKVTYWVPLADDGVTIMGKPILAIGGGASGSYDELAAQITTTVDGKVYYDASTAGNVRTTAIASLVESAYELEGVTQPPLSPPLNALVTTVDFSTVTSKPANIVEVIETAALIDYTTEVKITASVGDGAYLFLDQSFIPNNVEFVEWEALDVRTANIPSGSSIMVGFSSDKAKLSSQQESIILTNGLAADSGAVKVWQRVSGVQTNDTLFDAIWPYGFGGNYGTRVKKDIGFRWYPQKGLLYITGESNQTCEQVTLNASFDKSKPLYPFIGMRNLTTGTTADESFKLARFKIKAL